MVKRYWFTDYNGGPEYITNAKVIKHLAEKTKIPKEKIRILRVYHKKDLDENDPILLY